LLEVIQSTAMLHSSGRNTARSS